MPGFQDKVDAQAAQISAMKAAEQARLLQEQQAKEQRERELGSEVAELAQDLIEVLRVNNLPVSRLYQEVITGEELTQVRGLRHSRVEMRPTYAYQPVGMGWDVYDDAYVLDGEFYGPYNRYGIDTAGRMYRWSAGIHTSRVTTDGSTIVKGDQIVEYLSNTKSYEALLDERLIESITRKIAQ